MAVAAEEEGLRFACRGCGASLEYSAGTQSLKCDFCGAITEIPKAQEKVAEVSECEDVIPLTVDIKDIEDKACEYMASGDLTPDDMLEYSSFTKLERMYVPAYTFKGRYEATWTASFGFDRQEEYTVWEKDSKGNSHPVTKTKTVTDWRPVNGTHSGAFSVIAYAGNQVPAGCLRLVHDSAGQDNESAFDPGFTAGVTVEPFALNETDTLSTFGKPQIANAVEKGVLSNAQGDHQKDWKFSPRFTEVDTRKLLVPLCHAVFDYKGKEYHLWTDGTTMARFVADDLPKDDQRARVIKFGYWPLYCAGGAIAIAFALTNIATLIDHFWWIAGATALAWTFGWMRKGAVLSHSKALRESILTQRRASATATPIDETVAGAFSRPKRPMLANHSKDMVVLPALCLVVVAAIAVPIAIKAGAFRVRAASAEMVQQSAPAPVVQTPVSAPEPALVPAAKTADDRLLDAMRGAAADGPTIRRLVAEGANPNLYDAYNAVSVLGRAIEINDVDLAEELIKRGANVNAVSKGDPAQPEFLKARTVPMMDLLLKYGADVNATDTRGNTVLHQYGYDPAAIKFLASRGMNVNKRNEFGKAPVDFAYADQQYVAQAKAAGQKVTNEDGRVYYAAAVIREFESLKQPAPETAAQAVVAPAPAALPSYRERQTAQRRAAPTSPPSEVAATDNAKKTAEQLKREIEDELRGVQRTR